MRRIHARAGLAARVESWGGTHASDAYLFPPWALAPISALAPFGACADQGGGSLFPPGRLRPIRRLRRSALAPIRGGSLG